MTTVHVTRQGPAPASYAFLHGLLGQGRNWAGIARALEPQGSLLIDLPAHGRSGTPPELTYPALADDVAAALREATGGQAVTLVGHSMGGKVAMQLALRHPDLVARLCVVDISPVAGDVRDFRGYVDALLAMDLQEIRTRRDADAALAGAAPDPTVRGFLLQNLQREGDGWRWAADLAALRDAMATIGGWPGSASAVFDKPVLWVAGARSPYVRPEHGEIMRAMFPRARLVTVKDAAHWVHADQPDVMAGLLRQLSQR